ncbi:hypothetical protein A2U01_0091987, partial [Trifolium medium]|nr:hypothetical protein [Trifolium medium]
RPRVQERTGINQVQAVPNNTTEGSNDLVQKLAPRIYRFLDGAMSPLHGALHCFETPAKNKSGTRGDSAKGG